MPELFSYAGPTSLSQKQSLSEINSIIRHVELYQADGFVAQVKEKFRRASKAPVGQLLLCVDSGASDHICSQLEAFETLGRNAPPKQFKVVHGTARIESEGVGTALLPVRLSNGKIVRIRLHNVFYIPSQPFNLISVPKCIDQGWEDPKFSECSWTFKGVKVPLTRHGNYFVECPSTETSSPSSTTGILGSVEQTARGPLTQIKQSRTEQKKQESEARYKKNVANRPYRERVDWQFSKTEYAKWAAELGTADGKSHCALFTDG